MARSTRPAIALQQPRSENQARIVMTPNALQHRHGTQTGAGEEWGRVRD